MCAANVKILGIDPGSRITGYGLVTRQGGKFSYLASGCIRITATSLSQKLAQIYAGISEVLARYQPNQVAIEKVFMAKNADSALKLGQARGAAITCLANHGLEVSEYAAKEVKLAVTGSGAAQKHQMQHMVTQLLKLNTQPPEDAADALGVALCHGYATSGLLALHLNSPVTVGSKVKGSLSVAEQLNQYLKTSKQQATSWRNYQPAANS